LIIYKQTKEHFLLLFHRDFSIASVDVLLSTEVIHKSTGPTTTSTKKIYKKKEAML
jgi:hypothetical protein